MCINPQKSSNQFPKSLSVAFSSPNILPIDQIEAEKFFIDFLQQQCKLKRIPNNFKIEKSKAGSAPTAEYKMDPMLYSLGHKNSVQTSLDKFKTIQRSQSNNTLGGIIAPPFPNCINYTTINQYALGANLGQGNYAQVKSAVHKDTGFRVAIKIYDKLKLHQNQQVKKSVSREIKLLSSLCNTDRPCDD